VGARGADVATGGGGRVERGGGGGYEGVEVLDDGVVYCGAGEAEEVYMWVVRTEGSWVRGGAGGSGVTYLEARFG